MAVGKQDETTIVHWHPGEATGTNGLGASAALQVNEDSSEAVTASGVRTLFDTRITLLKAKIIASGLLPTYTG